ncbi:unnamed protein product [Candida verbasci]|uniref:CCAAT-binding factor domain-containing protein n=1 Tax=Candida verbasci TaxID=1227364 RepID=A0A9W4XH60_9ASCO|nr:unnamed protein product [Candida verbasci]
MVIGLNLSSLKDKIATKLSSNNKESKNKKQDKKTRKPEAKVNETKEESKDDILRREALELGATEEDLKVLQDIESDENSEQEFSDVEDTKLDKNFGNDLSKFIKDIGLKNVGPEIVEEQNESEEEMIEEGLEEEELEEEESDEELENNQTESSEESEEEVIVQETKISKKKEPKRSEEVATVVSDKLIVPNRTDWYNIAEIPKETPIKLDRFARERLLDRAKSTIDKENKVYFEEFASNSSQKKFLTQILSDGTLNDKISALTLLIQEAPLHNLKAFDTLLSYCDKKSRTAALQSINALKDLFINGLLPDRKLVYFDKQPLEKDASDQSLAIYYFEDYLKKSYFKFIQVLEKLSQDPILHVRMNVVTHIFDLLSAKPEQEANLLKLGVNKLGDLDNKVSAKTSFQILQLEQKHPAMKKIICDAVIDIIFHQNNSDDHSQYYGITTLNQTILIRNEEELANSLVKTYFALFEKILVETKLPDKEFDKTIGESQKGRKNNRKNFKKGKKGGKSVKPNEKTHEELVEEKNARLFSALLTGLNRAFPFSNLPNEIFQNHLNTLFKITHSGNFNTSIQALVLINHIITQQKLDSDRYYRTLYESFLDSRLANSSKQGIYLNLLFKSLKNDNDKTRVLAFVKRILQICLHWSNIGAVAGMLFLLSELSKTTPEINDLMIDINSRPDKEETETETGIKQDKEYDPRKRDPKYANADKSSLWEINQFLNHYHPTISIYATSFLDGTPQQKPDLGLYTLSHFLDRFVYKNAKQKAMTKGSSIMQPLGGVHTGSLLVRATNVLDQNIPANAENWLNKKIEDIKPDEKFFHQYFTTKVNKLKNKKEPTENNIDEDGEIDDDAVWEALVKSKPDVEASDEEDFSDFDEEDFSDLDEEEEIEDEEDQEVEEEEVEEQKIDNEDEDNDEDEENEIFGTKEDDELSDSEVELKMLEDDEEFEDEEFEDEDEDEEIVQKDSKKRPNEDEGKKKNKKRRLKDLPTFASVEDYAQYLDSDDE